MSHTMQTYARLPVSFTRGEGPWLWDDKGHKYLDALSGIAVCNLGHAHPAVTQAITDQASKLMHTSNLYGIETQDELANMLCELSGMNAVFFCNSGAEANEAAIKIARRYGNQKGFRVPKIIVMENAFHGRTMATLSATGNPKVHEGFTPLVEGFVRVPFDDVDAVKALAEQHDDIAAILVEPIQGEGGVHVPSSTYLNALRDICTDNDWLLMLDEVQAGVARTGKWFAHQHNGIQPDVLSLAKGLGNGMPIGACLTNEKATPILSAGTHGTTFGGNPLACRAALAVLNTIAEQNVCEQAAASGDALVAKFNAAFEAMPGVVDVRNKGMMIGIELNQPCAELVATALNDHQILINVTAGNTIRLLPPLICNEDELQHIAERVIALVKGFLE